jgi:sulfide:quinone oxidoreductase
MGVEPTVHVVGAGPSGVAAARLLRTAGVRVRLFTPGARASFLPGTLDVALGEATPEMFSAPVVLAGVDVDGRAVEAVSGEGVQVGGRRLPADAVIAGPGLVPRRIGDGSTSTVAFWDPQAARSAAIAVGSLGGGTVAIVIAGMPYRCPPAPYGLAMRMAAAARRTGSALRVVLTTPEPRPLAGLGEGPGTFLLQACAAAGVEVHTGVAPDPEALDRGVLVAEGEVPEADLLLVVPPHGANPILASLAGNAPVVPVGPDFATEIPGLYVVGDAAATPYPKAAAPAAAAGELAAQAVLARLGLGEPPEPVPPTAECYIGHGDGEYSRLRLDYPDGPPPAAARVRVDDPSVALGLALRESHERFRQERCG